MVSAIIFGGFGLGRAIASVPDFGKAKVAAANMFCLLDRVPAIDSYSTEGLKPVSRIISIPNYYFERD